MLKLENISFSYFKNSTTVENISLTINKGEFIALCGRNGSGKTTLSRLIMGMEKPTSGKMYLDEKEITNLGITKRSRYIGYVFQQPERQMFKNTVYEEIAFGPEQQGLEGESLKYVVDETIKKLQLEEYKNEYPLNLSRGIRQRIAIASALAMKSEILILDEPTSGQDFNETLELMNLLRELNKRGLTIILITHNMEILAEYTNRILILSQGRLAYDGTPEELFVNEEFVEKLGLSLPIGIKLAKEVLGISNVKSVEDFVNLYIDQIKGDDNCE